MNEMTRLSRTENAMILELTQKASRDTDTLKTLTLLTLIYLPASLVAVSFFQIFTSKIIHRLGCELTA
jgi:hypothetical protein